MGRPPSGRAPRARAGDAPSTRTVACASAASACCPAATTASPYTARTAPTRSDLALFVNILGFSPMETLVAATRLGGEIMGKPGELGVVKAGALADLLLVDGDPLADITILQDRTALRMIMKDGAPPARRPREPPPRNVSLLLDRHAARAGSRRPRSAGSAHRSAASSSSIRGGRAVALASGGRCSSALATLGHVPGPHVQTAPAEGVRKLLHGSGVVSVQRLTHRREASTGVREERLDEPCGAGPRLPAQGSRVAGRYAGASRAAVSRRRARFHCGRRTRAPNGAGQRRLPRGRPAW